MTEPVSGPTKFQRRPRRLLVLGGSQGSMALNDLVPKALHKLRDRLDGWEIIHQSGEPHGLAARRLYEKLAIPARVEPFLDDMASLMHQSQLAISRAGGTTLAELAAAALPAVLIPYPHASDDHQRANAKVFEARSACRVYDSRTGAAAHMDLAAEIEPLLSNQRQRTAASTAMRSLARVHAAWHVATMVLELAQLPASRQPPPAPRRYAADRAASSLSIGSE